MSTTWINRGHLYAPHVTPVIVDCNFIVNPSDTAGLGITANSLKGQGVQNVFMHTSATPGKGPNGVLNPNPTNGIIVVQMADNFSRLYGFSGVMTPPLTGSNIAVTTVAAALTVGQVYTITVVGTSTASDWLALGIPPGVIPAVGVSFVAIATGAGSGSGQVQVMYNSASGFGSGIDHFEVLGNPALTLSPVPVGGSPFVGGWLYLAVFAPQSNSVFTYNSGTPASSTVATSTGEFPNAPQSGSLVRLSFYLSQSSVTVLGE